MNATATAPEAVSEDQLIDQYLAQLTQLSPNGRLELMARLARTLQSAKVTEAAAPLPGFVGAWATDPEADKMEAAILASRHFEAKPELEKWA